MTSAWNSLYKSETKLQSGDQRNMATFKTSSGPSRLDRFLSSFEIQQKCGVSNACGFVSFVSGLLYYFLKAVDEPFEVSYRTKEISGVSIRHVWLRHGDKKYGSGILRGPFNSRPLSRPVEYTPSDKDNGDWNRTSCIAIVLAS